MRDLHTGALLIHHARRDGTSYRGSGAIAACCELAFLLDREADDPNPRRRRLRCEKSRPAAEPPARWLQLASEAELARGIALIAEAEPYEKPQRERAPATADLARQVVDSIAAGGRATRAETGRQLGKDPSDGTLRRAFERAGSDGLLVELDDGRWDLASRDGNLDCKLGNGVANLQKA